MEKQGYSAKGKKVGRIPKYKTTDDRKAARQAQQRKYKKRVDAEKRDALVAAKAEAEADAEVEAEVAPARMPDEIDVENEEERQLHSVRIWSEAKKGELVFHEIGHFGTLENVAADEHCGYHALMAALSYIKRKCKRTVEEVRRDIWKFAMNRKYYVDKKMDLKRIYQEHIQYTGCIGSFHWMNTAEVGPTAAELYNVVVYVY